MINLKIINVFLTLFVSIFLNILKSIILGKKNAGQVNERRNRITVDRMSKKKREFGKSVVGNLLNLNPLKNRITSKVREQIDEFSDHRFLIFFFSFFFLYHNHILTCLILKMCSKSLHSTIYSYRGMTT